MTGGTIAVITVADATVRVARDTPVRHQHEAHAAGRKRMIPVFQVLYDRCHPKQKKRG